MSLNKYRVPAWIGSLVALFAAPTTGQGALRTLELWPSQTTYLAVASAGDTDGDGVADLIVGDSEGGPCDGGRFTLYSGATGVLLHEYVEQECSVRLGAPLSGAGDQNGDGASDYLVGAVKYGYPVRLYSGADGAVLHTFDVIAGGDALALGRLGDTDGDGIDELVIASLAPTDTGSVEDAVRIYHGGDFRELLVLEGITAKDDFGRMLAPIRDIDQDGAPDLLVRDGSLPGASDIRAYSGRTGELLSSVSAPESGHENAFMGDLAEVGDVDGDGRADFAVGHGGYDGPKHLLVYSGHDGSILFDLYGVTRIFESNFGAAVCGVGDLDLDGHADFAVGEPVYDPFYGKWDKGRVVLVSGRDGAFLKVIDGLVDGDDYGWNLASLDDVTGDALADIAVGGRHFVQIVSGDVGPPLPPPVLAGTPTDESFGQAVCALGDLDGDGHAELLVGSPEASSGGFKPGLVRIHSGRDGHTLLEVPGVAQDEDFGFAVAAVGDANGDGLDDFLVGAPASISSGVWAGSARLHSGADGALLHEWSGTDYGDSFGFAVAALGDVDGDGAPDIAIGAPMHTSSVPVAGTVYVFSAVSGAELYHVDGQQQLAHFGAALANIADLNADGRADLAIGAPNEMVAGQLVGTVRLVDGATGSTLLTLSGTGVNGQFGSRVAAAGDIDKDGTPDILIGSAQLSGFLDFGAGLVSLRSGADGSEMFAAGPLGKTYGAAIAGGGDVDGDGWPDFAVAAPRLFAFFTYGDPVPLPGRVHVHSGRTMAVLAVLEGEAGGDAFGTALCLADTDGDGWPSLLIGDPQFPPGEGPTGRVIEHTFIRYWQALGVGVQGVAGTPVLTGSGLLIASAPVEVRLEQAPPYAAGRLLLGFQALLAPFAGGVLVPALDVTASFVCDAQGSAAWQVTWPAAWPAGADFFVQAWLLGSATPAGLSASNALRGTPR